MVKRLVLSFIATDEPGQVQRIAETVAKGGGNWLESRMAHLAEKFAGVARISVPDDNAAALEDALAALRDDGFHLVVETAGKVRPTEGQVLVLDFVGPDHPGILHEISQCLAERSVSVESMKTELKAAPMGGGRLFHAKGRVCMPPGLDEGQLRRSLESSAEALMVDITLEEEIA